MYLYRFCCWVLYYIARSYTLPYVYSLIHSWGLNHQRRVWWQHQTDGRTACLLCNGSQSPTIMIIPIHTSRFPTARHLRRRPTPSSCAILRLTITLATNPSFILFFKRCGALRSSLFSPRFICFLNARTHHTCAVTRRSVIINGFLMTILLSSIHV